MRSKGMEETSFKETTSEVKNEETQNTNNDSINKSNSSMKLNYDNSSEESMDEDKDDKESKNDSTLSGKRNRKSVERFVTEFKVKEEEEVIEAKGNGVKLGDIVLIHRMISKTSPDDLKNLHKTIFNRPGTLFKIRRNIKNFNGFGFEENSKDYEKKVVRLAKLTNAELKKLTTVLGLDKKGNKHEVVLRVADFLNCPVDKGQEVPSKNNKGKPKKKAVKRKRVEQNKNKVEEKPESDSAGTNSEEKEKAVAPKSKKGTKTANKTSVKIKKVKKEAESASADTCLEKKIPLKPAKKSPVKKRKAEQNGKNSASAKKNKNNPPTDSEITSLIKKILDKANLEEVTMKKVCQQVYDRFPSHNLVPRKEFIKDTVKTILS